MRTRDALWLVRGSNAIHHRIADHILTTSEVECAGLVLFGHWTDRPQVDVEALVGPVAGCFQGMEMELAVRPWTADLQVGSIEMRISFWTSAESWPRQLACALDVLVTQGAIVAWAGDETGSPSVDDFIPEAAAGNIYAIMDGRNGFTMGSGLHEPLAWVDDEQLHQYAIDPTC